MLTQLQDDLRKYYRGISFDICREKGLMPFNPLKKQMDAYAQAHPNLTPLQLKAAQYEIIADNFTPVLFRNDPFYFEMGLKIAEYNGRCDLGSGGWLFLRNAHLLKELDPVEWAHYHSGGRLGLHLTYGFFDSDHHGIPYANVLKQGLGSIFERVREAAGKTQNPEQQDFYHAAERGLLAVKKIAERFAEAAATAAAREHDPEARMIYGKVAETAARVPWQPAETFYEGLAVIWFLHELCSVMDGIGISTIGSPDQLLHELYQSDLAAGRLTQESATELLKIWLIHTDCKLDFFKRTDQQYNAGEQGDTLTLGETVNELTFMILKIHREMKLIYPKIHCRINSQAPEAYLQEACKNFFIGRNVLDFLNDDVIIPAQVRAGKDLCDAKKYVAGGCWEVMLEHCEHSQGANCYFDLARAMDLTIQGTPEEESALGLRFERPDNAKDFEELYSIFMRNIKMCLAQMLTLIRKFGQLWPEINPAPFYSVCMDGCIESGQDYSAGGAKYSPHGVPLTDVAIFVNSLLVLRELCFEKKAYSLVEVLTAVRENWQGYEQLRREALAVPHFGDGSGTGTALLKRILHELADFVSGFKNERGGPFQCGLYSYVEIVNWAKHMRATPDGRFAGDFLAQGLTPMRLHPDVITDVFRDLSELPLDRFPANSLLTCSISSNGLTPEKLTALIRGWCLLKSSGMLQLNCISREELEDAMIHPEAHMDLIVRVYGYSARFIMLEPSKQQEFVSRQILQ